jgi:RNA polymerase sigma-70 factor, ECF subfamily
MSDVQHLVLLAKQGDHHAFAALYDQFAPLVRSLAYDATGCLPEADDLCQEIFLHAYRNLAQLRDAVRFPGWLMTTTRRMCANWRRTRRRHREVGLVEALPAVADSRVDDTDELEQVLLAVRQLPPKERMALHLFYLAEQPAELARDVLGLSNAGFYKLLERARQQAAVVLRKREVTR